MKLAVVGDYTEIIEEIVRHGEQLGFEMLTAIGREEADAVLCVLEEGRQANDVELRDFFEELIRHVTTHNVRRLVVFTSDLSKLVLIVGLDRLHTLQADWSVVTHDMRNGVLDVATVAKGLIAELTSVQNIRQVFALPAAQTV